MNEIVLASKSVGRKMLFEKYFSKFLIYETNVNEEINEKNPKRLVIKLSIAKAEEASKFFPQDFVFGFDTVVFCGGKIIGKPESKEEAKEYLKFLSGKFQYVYSGYCLINKINNFKKYGYSKTLLKFEKLSQEWIDKYVVENNVTLYAGGYAIQENDSHIKIIFGDRDVIIGAPMKKIEKIKVLKKFFRKNINSLDKFS